MTRTLRLLALTAALPLALSACNTGGNTGDTNVETGASKKMTDNHPDRPMNGDSMAAGIARDTSGQPTGKQLYDNAAQAKDKNHDGLAD